ncbi:hypothetical protein [Armatimonas sp.]|uniref:hypothetical protein n=1 Tax=Armatimonas sp. TaxID=1872638 RepID=UPI0037536DA3
MKIPNIPVPKQARVEELHKAVWDYLRTSLSFDEANTVKHQAEQAAQRALDAIITITKERPS